MRNYIILAIGAGAAMLAGAASAQGAFNDEVHAITEASRWGAPVYNVESYINENGQRVHVDANGNPVYVESPQQQQVIVGYDAWGQPVYGSTYNSYSYVTPQPYYQRRYRR